MQPDRRRLLALTATATGAAIAAPTAASAAPAATISALGVDASQFGLRPGSNEDQTRALQRAIDETARSRSPLAIAPGVYRVGGIALPAGAQIVGVRGATRLMLAEARPLLSATRADHIGLTGLVIDGGRRPLPERTGLVQFDTCTDIRISGCEIVASSRNGITCIGVGGEITDNRIADIADAALHSLDGRGLMIARNTVFNAGNNGIQVWRSQAGDDGTIVSENRIEAIDNRSGGSGQYGNAINVFRAGNVMVRGNRIKDCAYTAVRGNAASNIQIEGNSIVGVREVALYAEFGFEGAVIANNTVDGAAIGVSVTNFNEGGRLAVVQGNLIRNLLPKLPAGNDPGDVGGTGISVEADTVVSGNVVEGAPTAGIMLGFGQYLRDVAVTGNIVRKADIGIAVSVAPGAGNALIANNVIADILRGAIIGTDRRRIVTDDLVKGGAERYANLALSGNLVR
jgi:uncharacterized secreted repeat protein (TIGR03808 family)